VVSIIRYHYWLSELGHFFEKNFEKISKNFGKMKISGSYRKKLEKILLSKVVGHEKRGRTWILADSAGNSAGIKILLFRGKIPRRGIAENHHPWLIGECN